ncbi:hypothetical protein CK203_105809 [Vitis vinifera]|uniref:Uncharacterized protein n=1 Tax=Vitis vinifera TaxID=29760 RepID=A0A438D7R2_VITVI|nr:hypothetical protein CK203_105809 [Vitis vinifera]
MSMGKHHKVPFQPSVTAYKQPLTLAHADLWGHAPCLSSAYFKYYICFVDHAPGLELTYIFQGVLLSQHKCIIDVLQKLIWIKPSLFLRPWPMELPSRLTQETFLVTFIYIIASLFVVYNMPLSLALKIAFTINRSNVIDNSHANVPMELVFNLKGHEKKMEITIISFAIELATFSTTCEIILEYIKICGYDGALKN